MSDKQISAKEYECKLPTVKRKIDYSTYEFYDKRLLSRLAGLLHRCVANIFLRAYLKIVYRVKVVGKKNLAAVKNTGAVVVSNHIHPLDIQMISVFLFGMRKLNWLTLERNMQLSVHNLIKNSGGVPIPEDRTQRKRCLSEMGELLRSGGLLLICPEGSLVEMCEDIRPFKDGAFRFSEECKVPLLPVTLRFVKTAPSGRPYRHPRFIIDVAEAVPPAYPRDVIKRKAERIMLSRSTAFIHSMGESAAKRGFAANLFTKNS